MILFWFFFPLDFYISHFLLFWKHISHFHSFFTKNVLFPCPVSPLYSAKCSTFDKIINKLMAYKDGSVRGQFHTFYNIYQTCQWKSFKFLIFINILTSKMFLASSMTDSNDYACYIMSINHTYDYACYIMSINHLYVPVNRRQQVVKWKFCVKALLVLYKVDRDTYCKALVIWSLSHWIFNVSINQCKTYDEQ